ncbi:MAG TPA: 2Fe-2S iron-sulfur cluster-binding protein [Phycisphaerales bacterium]|nr:2Fe-2S iron-sulfur cluster-binding protein [Phycisphaerales bacterium]
MPTITINGKKCDFTPGQTILQAANAHSVDIPQYCYHDGLSVVASCRICLGEAMAPNKAGQLEPFMGGKLFPTCQTPAVDGMVVYTDSPKAVANQKAVMEYLLINHPLDCPVCDQSGECFLQDYSYLYGRGVSRFEEQKVKQPKKDLGPHVYLYSDRCIMCTRCVRFTREVTGTGELMVMGRGNKEEIDVFPGVPIDNELSANVIDLCPVGALLDKDFLFAQRVWFLKETPSIDPLTASGDNISIHHNEGKIYRIKPRTNMSVNKWWITDEVRYGWKFVHGPDRLRSPLRKQYGTLVEADYVRAYDDAIEGLKVAVASGKRVALVVSPMLPCEEAWALAKLARAIDPQCVLAVGPVPFHGEDKTFPPNDPNGFKVYAEKAPNARGVRRVLSTFGNVLSYEQLLGALGKGSGRSDIGGVIVTGNYPTQWATDELLNALGGKFTVLIDTLYTPLVDRADIVLPGATWAEKAGTFENARNMLQSFHQAIPVIEVAKSEGQIALDMLAVLQGAPPVVDGVASVVVVSTWAQVPAGREVVLPRAETFNAGNIRHQMAQSHGDLGVFVSNVSQPVVEVAQSADMQMVEL